jgi:hypothetical protein
MVDFMDKEGRRRQLYVGKTKREAERVSDEMRAKGMLAHDADDALTLAQFAPMYLRHKERTVKPATLRDYVRRLQTRILPVLL